MSGLRSGRRRGERSREENEGNPLDQVMTQSQPRGSSAKGGSSSYSSTSFRLSGPGPCEVRGLRSTQNTDKFFGWDEFGKLLISEIGLISDLFGAMVMSLPQ